MIEDNCHVFKQLILSGCISCLNQKEFIWKIKFFKTKKIFNFTESCDDYSLKLRFDEKIFQKDIFIVNLIKLNNITYLFLNIF